MAERRMFAKTIIDSDAFLDMPMSARLLYYDLSMRADDDGFVNSPKKIMRMIGATEDDLRILAIRKFIIPFDNGIVVIKHWYIHNYIRKDTYNETPYKEQKGLLELDENKSYRLKDFSSSQISVDEPLTQVRLGKDSIVKDSIGNINYCQKAQEIVDLYHECCPSLPKVMTISPKRISLVKARLKDYKAEQIKEIFIKAESSEFLRNGSGTWKGANFDWILNPNNFIKIMEGNYDNNKNSIKKTGYDLYRETKSSNYNFDELEKEIKNGTHH